MSPVGPLRDAALPHNLGQFRGEEDISQRLQKRICDRGLT
jgi:hypothetical protein